MSKRIEAEAELIISKYAEKKTREAFKRIERERCGKGCGCIRCAHSAVKDANFWVDWHGATNPELYEKIGGLKYEVRVDPRKRGKRGGWTITFNYED